jgi:hypothetical protein
MDEPWWPLPAWTSIYGIGDVVYLDRHPEVGRIRRYANMTVFDTVTKGSTGHNDIFKPIRAVAGNDDLTIRCVLLELAHG